MGIGSFLASAGRVGQGIRAEEAAMRQARQQQLALEELNRQNEFRRLQLEAPAPQLPATGLMLGAPMKVTEPEFTQAGVTGAGLAGPTVGVAAPAGAPKVVAPRGPAPVKLAGVTIPGFDSRNPIRLNDGVAGFQKVDPNASDFEQGLARKRNENLLDFSLSEISKKVDPWFAGIRSTFVSQQSKADLQLRERAGQWYGGEQAREYFRRNPETLDLAKRDPTGFFKNMLTASQRGFEAARGAQPTAPTAGAVSPGVIGKIAGAETGGVANPYQTPNLAGASSAFGKYQFTRGTWIDTYRKENPGTGLSDSRIWELRKNPDMQERLMARLTRDNSQKLASADLPVNDATIYLAHFLGAGGATKLLRADANAPVESILDAEQIRANPTVLKGKTVAQVAQWAAGKVGGAAPATSGTTQLAAAQVTPVPVRIDPSNFYLANPNATSRDTQIALQNRQELARMADMYRRAGMGGEFTAARLKMVELDNSLIYLQGMQGLQELALANDPRRLAAVWSDYAGVPVQLQPQTDGSLNIVVNGRVTQRGVSRSAVIDAARSSFDKQYVQTQAEAAATQATEYFKSQLRMTEKAAETAGSFAANIQLELLKGDNARATEIIKQMDPNGKITMLPDGSGQAILQVQGQTLLIDKGGVQIEGAPEGMVSGPSARNITGLSQRTVGVGTGG